MRRIRALLYVCQMTLWGGLPLTSHISLERSNESVVAGSFVRGARPRLRGGGLYRLSVGEAGIVSGRGFNRGRGGRGDGGGISAGGMDGRRRPLRLRGRDAARSGHGRVVLPWCLVFSRMGAPRAAESALVSVVISSALSLATFGLAVEGLEAAFFAAVALSALSLAYAFVTSAHLARTLRAAPAACGMAQARFRPCEAARGGARAASVRLRHRIRRGHHAHDVAYGGARQCAAAVNCSACWRRRSRRSRCSCSPGKRGGKG